MTTPFRIQRLSTAAIPLMESLLTVFGEAFGEVETYGASRPSAEYLQRLLGSDYFIAIVAVVDNAVVGGIAAYELLAVAEPFRRCGIATELIEELRRIAAHRGAYVVFVQADVGDAPAINLYTKLGTREDVLHFDFSVPRSEDYPPQLLTY